MLLSSIRNGRGFFSDYWLGSILGTRRKVQGPRLTSSQAQRLLRRLAQLRQRVDVAEPLPAAEFRERYARPILGDLFGYGITEDGGDPQVRLLVRAGDPGDSRKTLAAALLLPDQEELEVRSTRGCIDRALTEHGLRYGFILTPDVLRLVRRPGEGTKNAYFDLSLATAAESEDLESLALAYQILCAEIFTPGPDGTCAIDLLGEESRKHSAKVSEDLKDAVFRSAELLIQAFLTDVRERLDRFAPEPALLTLRDAALQVLYRLLFIFYAESRDERLQTHGFYLESYSLDRLVGRLMKTRRQEIPGNRFGHWEQLLALFRIYDQGLPALPGLSNIPPRGGTLFSETTREGAFLAIVRLPDSIVAELLLNLGTTRPRRGVGRERVSFRELAIEHLGAVYEGLLEYEPRVAEEEMIELRVQGREFILPPEEVVRLCAQKELSLCGPEGIVAGTIAGRLHPALVEDEEGEEEEGENAEEVNAEEEGEGEQEIKKGARARLIRRLSPGQFHFVPGGARKSSGSFYTREEIVEFLVRKALEGLVAGKSSAEIEALRIIDPACGSAHFLVGAARYLGRKLYGAYRSEQGNDPPPDFHPGRSLGETVRAEWEKDGEAWCKRRIVERCLYGVDLNLMAVQLAQVALWIESLAGDRPLSFFDHHIRCGNSLLGTWLERLHEPAHPSSPVYRGQRGLFEGNIDIEIATALDERLLIDASLPRDVRRDTPGEYEYKADRLRRAEMCIAHAWLLFDLRNAAAFIPEIWSVWDAVLQATDLRGYCERQPWWPKFLEVRTRERFFHWELQFPEIFRGEHKGFDAVIGNPPWDKVKPDRKEFYSSADVLIRAYAGGELDARIRKLNAADLTLAASFEEYACNRKITAACLKKGGDYRYVDWEVDGKSTGGDPDLFKFFMERGHRILKSGGRLGYLVPSAFYNNEGCTGLRHLVFDEFKVLSFYGFENREKIFDIDSRYKFVCLVLEKIADGAGEDPAPSRDGFQAAFMRHEIEELSDDGPKPWTVIIRKPELERLSVGTLAFLEYRSERDREIVLKMYGLLPGMEPRPLLGDQGPGTWNAKFYTEFHMTSDRDLWTRPDGRLWTPREICGFDWPADSSIPFTEVRAAMEAKGFWPLYEGKHIEQFLVDIKPVERWVNIEKAESKIGRPLDPGRKLVFRDIARNTDLRTMIAAVLPERSCANNKLPIIKYDALSPSVAVSVMNSFAFDFALRFRVSSTLNFTHVSRVAVPFPDDGDALKAFAGNASIPLGTEHIGDWPTAWDTVWILNRSVAEAYGLTAMDFEYVLSTFPVFARKRPAFFAFLQGEVKKWKAGS